MSRELNQWAKVTILAASPQKKDCNRPRALG